MLSGDSPGAHASGSQHHGQDAIDEAYATDHAALDDPPTRCRSRVASSGLRCGMRPNEDVNGDGGRIFESGSPGGVRGRVIARGRNTPGAVTR